MERSAVKYTFNTKGQITHLECLHYVDTRSGDRVKEEKSESQVTVLCLTLGLYGWRYNTIHYMTQILRQLQFSRRMSHLIV